MLLDDLPNTIDGLLRALRQGDLTCAQARASQRERFMLGAQTFAGVVRHVVEPWQPGLPFSGVAVAHKDIFEQDGYCPGLGRDGGQVCTGKVLANAPARLRAQGFHQLGTLSMAEDACSATAFTRRLPVPVNPLDPRLAVGGSSSGSAVAVASGMVYASLGTDTAGSVRIPSMTCGVMGLKTTHGLIDREGMPLLCPSLDSIGVLARAVEDLGHVLEVLVPSLERHDPNVSVSYWDAFETLGTGHEPVAQVVRDCWSEFAQPLSAERQRRVTQCFEQASHHVQIMMSTEVGQGQMERIRRDLACDEVRQLGMLGQALPVLFYEQSRAQRGELLQQFVESAFADADVLMLPLQLQSIPDVDEVYPGGARFSANASLAMHRMCGWINYLGLPALAMPVGTDNKGLPVSLQMIARPCHEWQLLEVGQRIQNELYGRDGIVPRTPQQKEISL
ncbi:amidase [Orrella marina]|uniref:Amidase domain-containing protein n=1 Tax=Orrella marina TaxID=2163011 RepID=A0A2R4XIR2_9BURK|nr:amidase [Orrella marina]AWB33712.1 hypothetical protein DBV39_08370 [Orrella marina]